MCLITATSESGNAPDSKPARLHPPPADPRVILIAGKLAHQPAAELVSPEGSPATRAIFSLPQADHPNTNRPASSAPPSTETSRSAISTSPAYRSAIPTSWRAAAAIVSGPTAARMCGSIFPPGLGPDTIAAAKRAQLVGLAIAAGEVLIADRAAFVGAAEQAGLFVFGWAS